MIRSAVSYVIPGVKQIILKKSPSNSGLIESVSFSDLQNNTGREYKEIDRLYNVRGALRGMYYQDNGQAKLFIVEYGEILLAGVDMRKQSPTFKKYISFRIGQESGMVFIPDGVASGYYVVSDNARITCLLSNCNNPERSHVLLWSDPILERCWEGIDEPSVLDTDAAGKPFSECKYCDFLPVLYEEIK